jgi:hypothetical protein
MLSYISLFLSILAATVFAKPSSKCLSDKEANTIATNWQSIWGTGYLKSISQLAKIATKDVSNFDGTYGAANIGLDALYAAATYVDPLVDNVLQYPEWVFHSCDQIAIRWGYTAIATGVNSYVKSVFLRSMSSYDIAPCQLVHQYTLKVSNFFVSILNRDLSAMPHRVRIGFCLRHNLDKPLSFKKEFMFNCEPSHQYIR